MKYILVLFLILATSHAKTNVSLSKLLLKFQGDEYNILVAPEYIVTAGKKKKKTNKAIKKGFNRSLKEVMRLVRQKELELNIKGFSKRGSGLPQYEDADIETYHLLKDMLKAQVILEEAFKEDADIQAVSNTDMEASVSSDDIDIDIDDSAFDISDDVAQTGSMIDVSPEDTFKSSFRDIEEVYQGPDTLYMYQVLHPFNMGGEPKMKNIHSVFGMAFFPTKNGALKNMRIYIILSNIKTEEDGAQIIAKEIKEFRWDRNHLFISGATGRVLRQVISGVLGEPFL